MSGTDVDDAAAEDVDQLANLAPLPFFGLHFDQHQVTLDEFLFGKVDDASDRDDLLELLADLIEHAASAADDERDSRELWILGFTDGEALNVERARGEHPRDMSQHARLVDDKCGKYVFHNLSRSARNRRKHREEITTWEPPAGTRSPLKASCLRPEASTNRAELPNLRKSEGRRVYPRPSPLTTNPDSDQRAFARSIPANRQIATWEHQLVDSEASVFDGRASNTLRIRRIVGAVTWALAPRQTVIVRNKTAPKEKYPTLSKSLSPWLIETKKR